MITAARASRAGRDVRGHNLHGHADGSVWIANAPKSSCSYRHQLLVVQVAVVYPLPARSVPLWACWSTGIARDQQLCSSCCRLCHTGSRCACWWLSREHLCDTTLNTSAACDTQAGSGLALVLLSKSILEDSSPSVTPEMRLQSDTGGCKQMRACRCLSLPPSRCKQHPRAKMRSLSRKAVVEEKIQAKMQPAYWSGCKSKSSSRRQAAPRSQQHRSSPQLQRRLSTGTAGRPHQRRWRPSKGDSLHSSSNMPGRRQSAGAGCDSASRRCMLCSVHGVHVCSGAATRHIFLCCFSVPPQHH